MTLLNSIVGSIKQGFLDQRGAKNLAVLAGSSLLFAYLFSAITAIDIKKQEREAHYYNATIIGKAAEMHLDYELRVNGTKGSFKAGQFLRTELQAFTRVAHKQVLTLEFLLAKNEEAVVIAPDPTRTRLANDGYQHQYDKKASSVEIQYVVPDGSNYVSEILYFVNLAGKPHFDEKGNSDNAPYEVGAPFFYIVTHQGLGVGDYGNWSWLPYTDFTAGGTYFRGIFDSSILPGDLVILPGQTSSNTGSRSADFSATGNWNDLDDSGNETGVGSSGTDPGQGSSGDWNDV